jgi:protein TonB
LRVIPLVVALVVLIGIVTIWEMRHHGEQPAPKDPETSQQSPAASAVEAQSPGIPSSQGQETKGAVAERVLPEVPPAGLRTIQGKVLVAVRVTVDATGAITDAELESPGPSKYFARLALESARSWKFKPAQAGGNAVPSVWLLHYVFRNNGIDVAPVEVTP